MRRALWLFAPLALVLSGCGQAPQSGASAAQNPPANPGATEIVPATMNTVGTKGRDYGGDPITEPISQYWKVQDRLALDTYNYAMKLYYAEHGEYPPTLEDVKPLLAMPLPPLKPGHEYVYDPKTGQLFVKRPTGAPAQ
ncbi:MAG: hypothetical protein HYS13_17335 [Planctomycetia bacterium]|nr:hypothetical protein [Planctomycetia bacterium]